jgi:hypothetical protein
MLSLLLGIEFFGGLIIIFSVGSLIGHFLKLGDYFK